MIPPNGKAHQHRYRTIRDAAGTDLGGCCRECGGLLRNGTTLTVEGPGGVLIDALEACSLGLLAAADRGEVEITRQARRTLEARRRRLRRQARRAQESDG